MAALASVRFHEVLCRYVAAVLGLGRAWEKLALRTIALAVHRTWRHLRIVDPVPLLPSNCAAPPQGPRQACGDERRPRHYGDALPDRRAEPTPPCDPGGEEYNGAGDTQSDMRIEPA